MKDTRSPQLILCAALVLGCISSAACPDEETLEGGADARTRDVGIADVRSADAGSNDVHAPDARPPDASTPDAHDMDAATSDGPSTDAGPIGDASAADLSVAPDHGSGGPNPCPEGQFLNLRSSACQHLVKEFGFRHSTFQAALGPMDSQLATTDCSYAGLLAALTELSEGGGGILTLPECEISIDNGVNVPDNSVLQGAGIGRTVLHASSAFGTAGGILRLIGTSSVLRSNIVLRDFTIRGREDKETNNIAFGWADNVLVERVESTEAGKSAFNLAHSRQATVRYCEMHHSYRYHGIGAKDCFADLSMDGPDADTLVSKTECSGGNPLYWTEDVAYYSNRLHHNAGMGLDSHSSRVEVAGNLLTDNTWTSKFPQPAADLWVHDNLFARGENWGAAISNQYDITDTTFDLARHVYYSNLFADHGTYGIRIRRITQLYFIDNEYVGNGHDNALRITGQSDDPPEIFFCPGDQVGEATIAGDELTVSHLPAGDPRCDLSAVNQIF